MLAGKGEPTTVGGDRRGGRKNIERWQPSSSSFPQTENLVRAETVPLGRALDQEEGWR
jgi:hypothetical protein